MAGSNRDSALCARPIYEGNEISCLQMEVLNTELRCPICLNILRDPVATECMHRFCAGCIEKCLRVGKKECPTCRKPVATRRNLRNDTNFQDLITKLYPDLEAFEEEEHRLISNVASRARMVAITAEQQQDMIEHQRNHPPSPHYHAPSYNAPKRPRAQAVGGGGGGGPGGHDILESDGMDESGTEEEGGSESFEDEDGDEDEDDEALKDGEGEDDDDDDDDYEVQRTHGRAAAPWRSHQKQGRPAVPARLRKDHGPQILAPRPTEVGFVLSRHPLETRMPSLSRDYITVSAQAKIHQLQEFLAIKLGVPEGSAFLVSTQLPNTQYQELRQDWSLETVIAAQRLEPERLELYWRYSSKAVGGQPQW